MLSRIVVALTGSIFAVTFAFAQDAAPSRLDAVQKSGKLRVCTPGDYKPFALAEATARSKASTSTWCSRRRRRSAPKRCS